MRTLILMALLCWTSVAAQVRHRPRRQLTMQATAFTRARQPTTSGTWAHFGTVAADPRILPLGTQIRITGTTGYDGEYLVTDTGAAIKGRRIDIYLPNQSEARRFGTRRVRVQVRHFGAGAEDARAKDVASIRRR